MTKKPVAKSEGSAHAYGHDDVSKQDTPKVKKPDLLAAMEHAGRVNYNLAKAADGRMLHVEERAGELKYRWITPTPIRELTPDELKALEGMSL